MHFENIKVLMLLLSDVIISTLGEGTFGKVVEVLDEETYVLFETKALMHSY